MEIYWLLFHPIGWVLIAFLIFIVHGAITFLLDLIFNQSKIKEEFKYSDSINVKNYEKDLLFRSERSKEMALRVNDITIKIQKKAHIKMHNSFKIN